MRIVSEKGFDPLCESVLRVVRARQITESADLSCRPCFRPARTCCCSCFNVSWPGMVSTDDSTGCGFNGSEGVINLLRMQPCLSDSDCEYIGKLGGISATLVYERASALPALLIQPVVCVGSGMIVARYEADVGFSCRVGGTVRLSSVVDTVGCPGLEFPATVEIEPTDVCSRYLHGCNDDDWPETINIELDQGPIDDSSCEGVTSEELQTLHRRFVAPDCDPVTYSSGGPPAGTFCSFAVTIRSNCQNGKYISAAGLIYITVPSGGGVNRYTYTAPTPKQPFFNGVQITLDPVPGFPFDTDPYTGGPMTLTLTWDE